MSEYRIRESGEIKSQSEIRAMHKNTSFPKVWGANVYEAIGIDPVLVTPKPESTEAYKHYRRNGAEQDASGNWVQAWVERDMFSEYTDGEGVVHTKAEQEAAYDARTTASRAENIREERNRRLEVTDFHALSDTVMSAEMTTYRQALRDVPAQGGFPHDITWPTEPS